MHSPERREDMIWILPGSALVSMCFSVDSFPSFWPGISFCGLFLVPLVSWPYCFFHPSSSSLIFSQLLFPSVASSFPGALWLLRLFLLPQFLPDPFSYLLFLSLTCSDTVSPSFLFSLCLYCSVRPSHFFLIFVLQPLTTLTPHLFSLFCSLSFPLSPLASVGPQFYHWDWYDLPVLNSLFSYFVSLFHILFIIKWYIFCLCGR